MSPEAQALLDRVKRGESVIKGQEDKRAARELFHANLVRWKQVAGTHGSRWGLIYVMVLA